MGWCWLHSVPEYIIHGPGCIWVIHGPGCMRFVLGPGCMRDIMLVLVPPSPAL